MKDNDTKAKDRSRQGRIRVFLFYFVSLVLALAIFAGGYFAGQRGYSIGFGPKGVTNIDAGKPSDVNFSLFWEAWNKLKDKSVQSPDTKTMIEGAISGTLSSLGDPYTTYFTQKQNQRFREDIQGEFSGIGVELVEKDNALTVVAPLSDTPAEAAGLKPGDIIESVDGVSVSSIGFDEAINRIRGAEGTVVKLAVIRVGSDAPISFEITRKIIVVKSVSWEVKESAGKKIMYIKIRQFGDDTESIFAQAGKEARDKKADGIILDLRNNPGGYLETSVNLASYFIDNGVIVSEKGKSSNNKDYFSTKNGTLKGFKAAILVNNGSASASEILAGAMQDQRGDKIIGEKTFGKGSVQELIDLSDGSAVKITVAKWYTPKGRSINGEGITPDIALENPASGADVQLERAISYLVTGE